MRAARSRGRSEKTLWGLAAMVAVAARLSWRRACCTGGFRASSKIVIRMDSAVCKSPMHRAQALTAAKGLLMSHVKCNHLPEMVISIRQTSQGIPLMNSWSYSCIPGNGGPSQPESHSAPACARFKLQPLLQLEESLLSSESPGKGLVESRVAMVTAPVSWPPWAGLKGPSHAHSSAWSVQQQQGA